MTRANLLALQGVHSSTGRCPWRIQFRADDLSVSAFFRPPEALAANVGHREVSLIALPILCDLAAEVRPKKVVLEQGSAPPYFAGVFDDAVGALLAEQFAHWGKPGRASLPELSGEFADVKLRKERLNSKRVVLGFSGGKDSVVALFVLLRAGYEVIPLLLNEGDRTWQDIRQWVSKLRGYGLKPAVAYLSVGRRKPLRKRYGGWYFSSYQIGWLVATLAVCAVEARAGLICLGIESSADDSVTILRGRKINHQHQKTTKHLQMLERFYQRSLHPQLKIASPISNATDTEVLKILLEHVPRNFWGFSSCGASNWRSKHCGRCVKCAFVYALLFVTPCGIPLTERIFRHRLLEDVELYRPWVDERFRMPPGCIGSKKEVWDAFETLVEVGYEPAVVRKWKNSQVRRRIYLPEARRNGNGPVQKRTSPLSLAVPEAASLVQDWLNRK